MSSAEFDENRAEIQSKTIIELQNDIKEYQKKERAYLVKLHIKDKEIRQLENYKNDLIKNENKIDNYLDPLMLSEFKSIKHILKEKDELLLAKDEELNSLQTGQNNPLFKKLVNKCRDLHKENMELYNYTQGGTLENLRHENGLEKDQLEQLMLKLKEKENIQFDLENEINEMNEVFSVLGMKLKILEDKNSELEKENKENVKEPFKENLKEVKSTKNKNKD